MFCRYCFRKEALNEDPIRLHQELPSSLVYLHDHPEIEEVILSGGDPLMLSNKRIRMLLDALSTCSLRRIRIHTRTPVTLPQRIDEDLAEAISARRLSKAVTVVTHFNHPRELTQAASEALLRLRYKGINLLNQSVLLCGVNDNFETLRELCVQLGDRGVIPYYLHHPDLTVGTQFFRVSLNRGLDLYRQLRGGLSGFLIPRYVIEIPGGYGKVELDSKAVQRGKVAGEWWLTSPLDGRVHRYMDLIESHEARQERSFVMPSSGT